MSNDLYVAGVLRYDRNISSIPNLCHSCGQTRYKYCITCDLVTCKKCECNCNMNNNRRLVFYIRTFFIQPLYILFIFLFVLSLILEVLMIKFVAVDNIPFAILIIICWCISINSLFNYKERIEKRLKKITRNILILQIHLINTYPSSRISCCYVNRIRGIIDNVLKQIKKLEKTFVFKWLHYTTDILYTFNDLLRTGKLQVNLNALRTNLYTDTNNTLSDQTIRNIGYNLKALQRICSIIDYCLPGLYASYDKVLGQEIVNNQLV